MKREKIKRYEEMKGIIERDDCYENRKVKFEDRICYEIEDCLHAMKEAGETPEKRIWIFLLIPCSQISMKLILWNVP